jgi:hypothetical protein
LVNDWAKIAIIDTENNSSDLYSHLGNYNVLPLDPPYSPEAYCKAISECINAGMECIIIDSASHEWSGTGGALDIQNALGGKFNDWAKVMPKHKKFIDAILQSDAHFIVTTRVKTEWVIEKNDKGKNEPKKAGLKAEQKEGIEYEMTIAFRLNQEHYATCDKDRTGLFIDANPFKIDESTGQLLRKWSDSGAPVEKKFNYNDESHRNQLKQILNNLGVETSQWKQIAINLNGRPFNSESIKLAVTAPTMEPQTLTN